MKEIRAQIEAGIVRPIFGSVRQNGRGNQSLPDAVFKNRKNRAYGRVIDALESRGAATIPDGIRTRLESMIEAWSTQAFDDAFQPIQEFEIQCARDRDLVVAQESGDPRKVLEVQEKDYRRRVIERFGSIELRGLQLSHRVILDLDKVYIPLHFEPARIAKPSVPRIPLDKILHERARRLLLGAPGSGKSTLISFLASRCAAGEHGVKLPKRALPFVVTVRELKDAAIAPEWLASYLGIAIELVVAVLKENRAVLLIDGLDEAPTGLRRELVTSLARFAEDYPELPVLVTSRPAGAPGETETCLAGFRGFRVADLTPDEVDCFIDKWCLAAERSARPESSDADEQAKAAATDLKARIKRSRPVQRIAVNPLLATILCVVHRFLGRTIPEHRVTLYEKCTDALLYEWDRAKFPENAAVGKLDANQKRVLLRGVASALHERHESEMPESQMVQHFARILPDLGHRQEDALRIVREIRDRSGVLVERRPGVFAFSHLTFQEYLTALDYASRSQELLAHAREPWWEEVIALAAGSPGCNAAEIIEGLLLRGDQGSIFLATKCLETAISIPLDLRERVVRDLELEIPKSWTLQQRFHEIGPTVAPIAARCLATRPPAVWALDFFHWFPYEPAIPVLVQLASEHGDFSEWAIQVLATMGLESERARAALISFLTEQPVPEWIIDRLETLGLVGSDFKPYRPGKRPSKRAKSIASKRPSKLSRARQ